MPQKEHDAPLQELNKTILVPFTFQNFPFSSADQVLLLTVPERCLCLLPRILPDTMQKVVFGFVDCVADFVQRRFYIWNCANLPGLSSNAQYLTSAFAGAFHQQCAWTSHVAHFSSRPWHPWSSSCLPCVCQLCSFWQLFADSDSLWTIKKAINIEELIPRWGLEWFLFVAGTSRFRSKDWTPLPRFTQ